MDAFPAFAIIDHKVTQVRATLHPECYLVTDEHGRTWIRTFGDVYRDRFASEPLTIFDFARRP